MAVEYRGHQRYVILTCSTGGGHNVAARELQRLLEAARAEVVVVDFADRAYRFISISKLYTLFTQRFGRLWGIFYCLRETGPLHFVNRRITSNRLRALFPGRSIGHNDTVIIVHSLYMHIAEFLSRRTFRVLSVCVDLYGGPRAWFNKGCDLYIVPTITQKLRAVGMGVPEGRIKVRSIAYHKGPRNLDSDDQKEAALSADILIAGGYNGNGPIFAVVDALRRTVPNLTISVCCGMNQVLHQKLAKRKLPRVKVHGYVDNLETYFSRFTLVITKCGSGTISNLLDANVPFLIMAGIPGIEHEMERVISRLIGLEVITDLPSALRVFSKFVTNGEVDLSSISAGCSRLSSQRGTQLEAADLQLTQ